MGIVSPEGVWMSVDFRVSRLGTGELVDDRSQKLLHSRCSDGAVLIAVTGFGECRGRPILDWVRGFLRGENRTIGEQLEMIQACSTKRLGGPAQRLGVIHAFGFAGFSGGQPFAGEIANVQGTGPGQFGPPESTFHLRTAVLPEGMPLAGGSGKQAISPDDVNLLKKAAATRPSQPKDYQGLLAAINRRTAESMEQGGQSTVSRACQTAYMPPGAGDNVRGFVHAESGEETPVDSHPVMVFGIDMTDQQKLMFRWMKEEISKEEHDRMTEELGPQSVTPQEC